MPRVRCPGCGRPSIKLEVTGSCEHCGQSALETDGPEYLDADTGDDANGHAGKTTITLEGRHQRVDTLLPSLCMCCGSPATTFKEKQFGWYPRWVFLLAPIGLPFLIVLMVTRQLMTVKIPLCDRHRNPWMWQYLFLGFVLSYFFPLPCGLICLSVEVEKLLGRDHPLSGAAFVGWILGMPILIVVGLILRWRTIHVKKITSDEITLGGVSETFADGLHKEGGRW